MTLSVMDITIYQNDPLELIGMGVFLEFNDKGNLGDMITTQVS